MRLGISVMGVHPRELLQIAVAAEAAGVDTIWLGEHIVVPTTHRSRHPSSGTVLSSTVTRAELCRTLVDPLVALGAAASVTHRINLATGIYLLPLRHPLAVARMAATVQDLAGGRFMLGVAAGWLEEEFLALGVSFNRRGSRLDESIAVLRLAWAGGVVEHAGEHFPCSSMISVEEPVEIPIIIGGNSRAALQRAARVADGWLTSGAPPLTEAIRLRELLRQACEEIDRPHLPQIYVRMAGRDPDVLERYSAEGFDHVTVSASELWPEQGDDDSKREQFAARLGELTGAVPLAGTRRSSGSHEAPGPGIRGRRDVPGELPPICSI